jgi:hypothetical protein
MMGPLHYRITIGYHSINIPVHEETTSVIEAYFVGAKTTGNYSSEEIRVELIRLNPSETLGAVNKVTYPPYEVGEYPDDEKTAAAE